MRPSLLLSFFAALLFAACDSSDPAADSGSTDGGASTGGSGGSNTGGSGGEPLVCDPACDPGHRCSSGLCQPRFEVTVLSPARDEVVGPRFTVRLGAAPTGPDVSELPTFDLILRAGDTVLPLSFTQGVAPATWLAEVDASSLGADDLLPLSLDGSIVTLDGALALPTHAFFADTLAPRVALAATPAAIVGRDAFVDFWATFDETHPDPAPDAIRFGALPASASRTMESQDCTLVGGIGPAGVPPAVDISLPARQPGLVVDGAQAGFRFGVCVRDVHGNEVVRELTDEVVITRQRFSVSAEATALTSPAMLPNGNFVFGAEAPARNFVMMYRDGALAITLALGAPAPVVFAPAVFGGRVFVAKGRSLLVREAATLDFAEVWACADAPADLGSPPVIGTLSGGSDPLVVLTRQGGLQSFAALPTCASVPSSDYGLEGAWPTFGLDGELYVGGTNATSFQSFSSDSATEPTLALGSQRDGSGTDLRTIRLPPALDGTTAWVAPTDDASSVGFIDLDTGAALSVRHGATNTAPPIVSATHAIFPTDVGLVFVDRTTAGAAELIGTLVPLGNSIPGSPVAGSDGLIYAVDAAGTVHAVAAPGSADSGLRYSAPISRFGAVTITSSPTLTTAGVLVIGDTSGTIHGFITDAATGLDPNAPWPKYQHDAGNTGNAAAPLYPR